MVLLQSFPALLLQEEENTSREQMFSVALDKSSNDFLHIDNSILVTVLVPVTYVSLFF